MLMKIIHTHTQFLRRQCAQSTSINALLCKNMYRISNEADAIIPFIFINKQSIAAKMQHKKSLFFLFLFRIIPLVFDINTHRHSSTYFHKDKPLVEIGNFTWIAHRFFLWIENTNWLVISLRMGMDFYFMISIRTGLLCSL